MSLRYRSDREKWEVSVTIRGVRKRPLFQSKKEAVEFERNCRLGRICLRQELDASISLEDAFRAYFECESVEKCSRSQNSDKRYINFAYHFFKVERKTDSVEEIQLEDLQAFRHWVALPQKLGEEEKRAWSEGTVSRCCATLKRIFRFLVTTRRTKNDPTLYWSIPVPSQTRRRPMSYDQFSMIYDRSPEWFKTTLKFMYLTGARGSSVSSFTWRDVDLTKRVLRLKSKKGAKARVKVIEVAMIDELFALLAGQRNKFPFLGEAEAVFRNESGAPLSSDWISKVGNNLIKSCGLKGLVLYGLRHGLATDMTEAGVPTEVVRQALGHSDIRTTQGYAQGIAQASVARAVDLVRSANATRCHQDSKE